MFELSNPAFVNIVNGNGIEVVELFASLPLDRDKIRVFEQAEMLCNGLARHTEFPAQFAESLAISCVQAIEQFPASRIGQSFEHLVDLLHRHMLAANGKRQANTCTNNRQVFACLSSGGKCSGRILELRTCSKTSKLESEGKWSLCCSGGPAH